MISRRVILHFDMNSYFASVEQQANPRLRGKPVGIAATMVPGGCLIATSKEAKAEGIVTGLSVRDGLRLDPQLKIVEVDPPKYKSTTEKIFGIVAEYSEAIEPYSIDEAFVDFTGSKGEDSLSRTRYGNHLRLRDVAKIAETIRQRITNEVGDWLTCSMGVAPTRWLAKFASDTAPKGGLVVLDLPALTAYIFGRPVTDAWGIAKGLERRLNQLGITTLDELQAYPVTNLMEVLGVKGYELWANLNGIELGGVQAEIRPKTVGHSHVLRVRTTDARFHRGVLMKLCDKTGRRLRQLGLEARGVWVGASCLNSSRERMRESDGRGGHRRLREGITSSRRLYEISWSLLEPQVRGAVIAWLGVTALNLGPHTGQSKLWPETDLVAAERAIDEVNDRYGEYMLQWGAMVGMKRQAPERIGYRKSVKIDDVLHDVSSASVRDTG